MIPEAPLGAVAITAESRAYWEGARRGVLLLPRCRKCGEAHFYPRSFCPHCFSEDLETFEATGRGTVYTFSVMRRAGPPYAIAYVRLDEGPTLLSRIVGTDFDAIHCGMCVRVTFRKTAEGADVPVFEPNPSEPTELRGNRTDRTRESKGASADGRR